MGVMHAALPAGWSALKMHRRQFGARQGDHSPPNLHLPALKHSHICLWPDPSHLLHRLLHQLLPACAAGRGQGILDEAGRMGVWLRCCAAVLEASSQQRTLHACFRCAAKPQHVTHLFVRTSAFLPRAFIMCENTTVLPACIHWHL